MNTEFTCNLHSIYAYGFRVLLFVEGIKPKTEGYKETSTFAYP